MHPSWVPRLIQSLEAGPCVLVTLRPIKGSAPRESGARMVVSAEDFWGSIGGGNLEFKAIAKAREMLSPSRHPGKAEGLTRDPQSGAPGGSRSLLRKPGMTAAEAAGRDRVRLETVGLGPELNQCCGGWVELMFEAVEPPAPEWLDKLAAAGAQGDPAVLATAAGGAAVHLVALPVGRESDLPQALRSSVRRLLDSPGSTGIEVVEGEEHDWWLQRVGEERRQVVLFGAGHVGQALVRTLAELPFQVRWLDSREGQFPGSVPANTQTASEFDFREEVAAAPPRSLFIVMTHSHELDEDICHAILGRDDFAFLGLIGSETKGRRFAHRLAERGISEEALTRLTCPIGLAGIRGKQPATIALGIAAQLMMDPHGHD